MNSVFGVSVGVKSACNKGFWGFEYHLFKLKNLFTTHYSQFTKKVFAFTLAETLIVMGVIGVVAALTLPNLNQSTNNKEKVVKVKKIYQNLNDAFGRAEAIYGPSDEWYQTGNATVFGDRLTEFMKLSKNCKYQASPTCISTGNNNLYNFITADGTAIGILSSASLGQASKSMMIFVDIDGKNKGKNKWGTDMFIFGANIDGYSDKSIVPGCMEDNFSDILSDLKDSEPTCAAYWILQYDNMDYLKCANSLSATQTTCK